MRAVLPRALAEREDAVIRDMILSQLDTLGFDKTEVLDALQKNAHNNTTASYYLLYSKLVRIMKDRGSSKASSNGGGMTPRGNSGVGVSAPVPQHKRLDEPTQSRPSPTHASQVVAKKIGSVGAMAGVGAPGQPQNSSSNDASSQESSSSARRYSTQPSSSPHYNKENVTRAATPSGASPRHPHSHYAQQQQQQQAGISHTAAAPSPSSSQPRRPSSVRSGRNLVLLSNGGNQPMASAVPPSGVGAITVPPRRPSGSIIMKPSGIANLHAGAAGTSRVSVSNGMVALTPIAHHPHRTSAAPTGSHATPRRHTLEVSHHASPRSSMGTAAHPPTTSNVAGTTSLAGSSGDSSTGSAIVARRRISLHPAAAATVALPGAEHHETRPTAPDSTVPHVPSPAASSLKEDDSRQPQSSSIRIHAPQPPSGARHGSHFAAIL